jgi:hypothetical protein
VADEQHGDAVALGHRRDARGDLADLPHAARGAAELGGGQRLHGVDHARRRALGLERRADGVEVGLRQHGHVERRAHAAPLQALGPQADLGGGLLARDVQRGAPAAGEMAESHVGQRRLADAGRAPKQDERPRHQPAAEHAVELADLRVQARRALGPDVAQRHGPGGGWAEVRAGAGAVRRRARAAAREARALLDERVPLPAARALPVPARLDVCALRAHVDGRRPGHVPRLGAGPDGFAPGVPAGGPSIRPAAPPARRRAGRQCPRCPR